MHKFYCLCEEAIADAAIPLLSGQIFEYNPIRLVMGLLRRSLRYRSIHSSQRQRSLFKVIL